MHPEGSTTRQQLYRDFIEFIRIDIQRERLLVHRRMFNAFLWCFVLPAAVSLTLLLLIKFQILPRRTRAYLDWVALVFPICYSLYVLGNEVLAQVPMVFRRGGVAVTLGQALKDAEWRERVRAGMVRSVRAKEQDWEWIIENFRIDLAALQARTRFLTALAGAVFFLLMQGIDSLGDAAVDAPSSLARWPHPMEWIQASAGDLSQFVGLALFLVLLYLSGSQTHHSLARYLSCAELNQLGESLRKDI